MGFRQLSTEYDASYTPIWRNVDRRLTAGGLLSPMPTVRPCTIPAGTPVYLDQINGGTVTYLETFMVAAAVGSGDTAVTVYSAGNVPQLTEGMKIMKAPATYDTTGVGVAVGAVTVPVGTTHLSFAITANALGTLAEGDILVIASDTGAGASIAVKPNGLVWHDLRIRVGDYAQDVTVVVSGQILESRISPIPDCVKAKLPMITFEKEV